MRSITLSLLIAPLLLSLALPVAGAATGPTPTVFGQRAELHLKAAAPDPASRDFLNFVHAGSRVTAVGLGFHAGAGVRLIYAMASTSFLLKPIARSVVGRDGRFQATFTVTRAMAHGGPWAASGLYRGPIQPLLIEAFEGSSPGVGPHHAYAVAALVVSSS